MANPHTGEVSLQIGGGVQILSFDWRAISQIRADLGADGQARALAGDLEPLATLVAIGLSRHNPDWDAARVTEASPPVMSTIKAVESALAAAWFGPDGLPKDESKANPPQPPQTQFGKLWRRLTGQA